MWLLLLSAHLAAMWWLVRVEAAHRAVERRAERLGPSRFGPARLTDGPCLLCELERQVRIDAGYRRLAEDVWGDDT